MPLVVVLHGLGRSRLAMWPLAARLRGAGYRTLNLGYAAARRPLALLAQELNARLDAALGDAPAGEPLHFVTHSLGGLLARHYLAARPERAVTGGRVVQLAPPNQGAWIAGVVRTWPLVRAFPGATVDDFTSPDPPPHVELGVIAGRSLAPWIPDPSDGIVRVAETWHPAARDWIELRHFHTFIMNGRDTARNVCAFLRDGRFLPDAPRLVRDGEGRIEVVPGSVPTEGSSP